jgi:hypothetical protein
MLVPISRHGVEALSGVDNLVFDANGRRLGAAGGDGVVWDVSSGEVIFKGQTLMLNALSIAFSPDGSRLASGNLNGSIRMWEITEGGKYVSDLGKLATEVVAPDADTDGLPTAVVGLQWSESGTLIAVGANGSVVAMPLNAEVWRQIACRAAGRDLFPDESQKYFNTSSYKVCVDPIVLVSPWSSSTSGLLPPPVVRSPGNLVRAGLAWKAVQQTIARHAISVRVEAEPRRLLMGCLGSLPRRILIAA